MSSEDLIGYVLRYGGMSRDCADLDGVCQSGQPCDTDQRRAVVKHTISALAYGIDHGFIANPFTAALAVQTQQGAVKALEWSPRNDQPAYEVCADTPFGRYKISNRGEYGYGWQQPRQTVWSGFLPTSAEAKAAAQADYEQRIRSALVDVPAVIPTANCCICGRIIDTREKSEGGDDHGDETAPGKWTCSIACYDAFTGYVPDVPAVEPVAHIIEAMNGADPRVYLTQKYDPRKPDFWLNEEARAKHRVTPLYAHPPHREGEDSAEVERLRGLLDVALETLDNYADQTGYTDSNGEQLPADDGAHPGLLAKQTARDLRTALAATRSGSATEPSGGDHG